MITMYRSALSTVGVVGIVLLLAASVVVFFNQQAMAAPQGSIFEGDEKAFKKLSKSEDKDFEHRVKTLDKVCEKGGDIVVEPGTCVYDPS
jgi:hypothetical protein